MLNKIIAALVIIVLIASGGSMIIPGSAPSQVIIDNHNFADGSTNSGLLFSAPGNNTSLSLKLPKNVTISKAVMDISGQPLIWNESFVDTSQADFQKFNLSNIDINSTPGNVSLGKPYDDNFEDKSLDPKWKWMNQALAYEEGISTLGALSINASTNTNFWGTQTTGNFLYQNINSGFYSTTLKVNMSPTISGQQAGLMAYSNSSYWVALMYGKNATGTRLSRINTKDGISVQTSITIVANPIFLKVDRTYGQFKFSYSTDGINYIRRDDMNVTWTGSFVTSLWTGLAMTDSGSGSSFKAVFDDFWISIWYPNGVMNSPEYLYPGEIQSCELQWDANLLSWMNITVNASASQSDFPVWETLTNYTFHQFINKGNLFQYNINFTNYFISGTPIVSEIRGNITIKDQPANVSIDISNNNGIEWKLQGPLGTSSTQINITNALSREIMNATADFDGNVNIPMRVHSEGKGTILISNLSLKYILNSPPSKVAVQSPANATWVTTLNPSLTFNATDPDGGTIQYQIALTRKGNENPFIYLNQTSNPSGWTAQDYITGETANYTFPGGMKLDQNGKYIWQARAYDGWTLGPWSDKSEFYIDITPSEGWVIDDGLETTDGTTLHCNLSLTDPESGIVEYEAWLGTTRGGSDLMPPTTVTDPNLIVNNITLVYGYTYYFTARALNGAGLWSNPVSSDGIGVKKGAVNHLPTVNITTPNDNATVSGIVKFSGNASDIDFLDTLTVSIRTDNSNWLGVTGNTSWNNSWDSSTVNNGIHTVMVRAWDGRDYSSIADLNINVQNKQEIEILNVIPSLDSTIYESQSLNLSAIAQDPLSRHISYMWMVDDIVQPFETNRTFTYRTNFDTAGFHKIKLTVYANPAQTNYTWNITVLNVNRPPVGVISAPTSGMKLTLNKMTKFETKGSYDPDKGDILYYTWDFGDGTSGNGITVNHTYNKVGKYLVKLRVTDSSNDMDNTSIEVEVRAKNATTETFWSSNILMLIIVIIALTFIGTIVAITRTKTKRPARSPVHEPDQRIYPGPEIAPTKPPAYKTHEKDHASGYSTPPNFPTTSPIMVYSHITSPKPKTSPTPIEKAAPPSTQKAQIVSQPRYYPKEKAPTPQVPPSATQKIPPKEHEEDISAVLARLKKLPTNEPAVPPVPAQQKKTLDLQTQPLKSVPPPETPILFSEMPRHETPLGFTVEDVFLIYQDGRLIQHTTRRIKADMDVDILTSMLRAVQDFVKESIGMEDGVELGSMEYGDNKIILEKGKYVVLAAVVSGGEPDWFREEMRNTIKNIESEYGAILPTWDGASKRLAGAKRFLVQIGGSKEAGENIGDLKSPEISLKGEIEFYQGFVRLKVAVKNGMPTLIADASFRLVYNKNALRHDHIEPEYPFEEGEVKFGNVMPREKVTAAIYLDPLICTESSLEGVLTFRDAQNNFETVKLKTTHVAVVCPIMYTDENINTAMLKRMAIEELDKKDTKVFSIPPNIISEKAFDIAKSAIQHHDIRLVREFKEIGPFIGEAWYYGKAKGREDKLVVRARVFGENKLLEFFVASNSTLMLTGMLAELKSDLNKELTTLTGKPIMKQVTAPEDVANVARIRTLLERKAEAENNAGDTEIVR